MKMQKREGRRGDGGGSRNIRGENGMNGGSWFKTVHCVSSVCYVDAVQCE